MQKLVTLTLVVMLLIISCAVISGQPKQQMYIMTSTSYSNHPSCISDKHRDGKTAMNTPIREGVVAINCDYINGKWQVVSPLKLGQKIYIEGVGNFVVEDTGKFTESNFHFDMWNLDIFKEDYEQAVAWGVRKVRVFVLED